VRPRTTRKATLPTNGVIPETREAEASGIYLTPALEVDPGQLATLASKMTALVV